MIQNLVRAALVLGAVWFPLRAVAGDAASIPIGPNALGACPGAAITPDQVVTGQFPAALMGAYVMLPIEVPEGTTQVRVKYCWEGRRQHRRPRHLAGARRGRRRGVSSSSAAGADRAIPTSRSRRRGSRAKRNTSRRRRATCPVAPRAASSRGRFRPAPGRRNSASARSPEPTPISSPTSASRSSCRAIPAFAAEPVRAGRLRRDARRSRIPAGMRATCTCTRSTRRSATRR